MSKAHQALEKDVEEEEQKEKINFEEEIGKQQCKTTSGNETAKCSEPSSHLEVTREKHSDNLSQVVPPAGQECTSYYNTSKFIICNFHTLYSHRNS